MGQPPSFISIFLYTAGKFWSTELTLTKCVGPVKQKTFRQNYMRHLFAWKPSLPEFFWSKKGFPCKNVRHCETKVFQRRIVISPLYAKRFSITEVFWNIEWFSHENFRYCETKKFDRKTAHPPSLNHIFFVHTKKFLKQVRDCLRIFSGLWSKKSLEKIMILSPLSCIKTDDARVFFETKESSPANVFRTLTQKNFD